MLFDIVLENLPNRCASTKHAVAAVPLADVLTVLYVARLR